ncbi:acyl-CoA dehydrogenase family protein [Nocardioides sp.]|uniref:acyl-CoA dehydrogenase family protein n=1 Tax=Nocardioides sp. TaxID=35761 RepID=UPI00262D7180|nr:acyl-CoA dehydrogenase family protein [Nocardioides sp.]MDI6912483.1 acyl-CoA dehydrogenase family protein [Nocardioides sp.]
MVRLLNFPRPELDERHLQLRTAVREFLDSELSAGTFQPTCDSWLSGHDPVFSKKLGQQGWIGMTWPREYGGQGASQVDRYILTEELLAAGAPVAAHWVSDRQIGPGLLRHGSEAIKRRFLPAIASGECYFSAGMSEPDSGSDLASIRTKAVPSGDGWAITGQKVWTSHAHHNHYIIILCRTSPRGEDLHEGISQIIVPLDAPGLTVRPIRMLSGEHHFNEVILDEVYAPAEMILGAPGSGWSQVTGELAFERSGPERFLAAFPLVAEVVRRVGPDVDDRTAEILGRLASDLMALRRLSMAVATALDAGTAPPVEAAMVKDIGSRVDQQIPELARRLLPTAGELGSDDTYARLYAEALTASPGFTLRGGAVEILRGIVARGMGMR